MSVMEKNALDMSALLTGAYELGDMVLASQEAAEYFRWKAVMAEDPDAQAWIRQLQRKKDG